MNPQTLKIIQSAEGHHALVEKCQEEFPLREPSRLGQVIITGKWLINAIGTLLRELPSVSTEETREQT